MATRKPKASAPAVQQKPKQRKRISTQDFVNSSLKTFSLYDNVRSIPGIDGLKPAQRKAIYGNLQRGETAGELQVERLASFIAQKTDYHHGAVSMVSTLVGLAADLYPGSNNMNIFHPEGQFGSRLTKEPGAGRYISTAFNENFRKLFRKEDDAILVHNQVDGTEIEPKLYLPLLPFVLINGATGMGTGHSCEIKSYNPNELRDAVLQVLAGKSLVDHTLVPFFNGFHGTVHKNPTTGQLIISGKLEVVNSTTIRITELPVGVFLDQYKEHLNKLEEAEFIKDYVDGSREDSFEFTVTVPRTTTMLSEDELMAKFKLIARDTENFTMWNADGVLQRFKSAEEIIKVFTDWRLTYYSVRRDKLISTTEESIRILGETIRFIEFYIEYAKDFRQATKAELSEILLEAGFTDWEKLIGMPVYNLTFDRITELTTRKAKDEVTLAELQADTALAMYRRELKAFKY